MLNSKIKYLLYILVIINIFLFQSFLSAENISNQSIRTEIYVPKVIIEGKWGTGQGEFGRGTIPFTEDEDDLIPESLAVDSKGNIYILDTANNRIQKYDNNGKYIKSISVPSWKGYGEKGEIIVPSEAIGINVVLDDEDNLYYHFIKNKYKSKEEMDKNGDGKINYKDLSKIIPGSPGMYGEPDHSLFDNPNPKDEVWKFKDDVLVKKWETKEISNIKNQDAKLEIKDKKCGIIGHIVSDYMGGTRFESEKDYVIEKQKINKSKEKVIIKFKDGKKIEKVVKAHRPLRELKSERGKKYFGGREEWGSYIEIIKNRNEFFLISSIYNPDVRKSDYLTYIYDLKGDLKSILKGAAPISNDGNTYDMKIESNGIKVIKYERQIIKK